jgi:hypothetical protein
MLWRLEAPPTGWAKPVDLADPDQGLGFIISAEQNTVRTQRQRLQVEVASPADILGLAGGQIDAPQGIDLHRIGLVATGIDAKPIGLRPRGEAERPKDDQTKHTIEAAWLRA